MNENFTPEMLEKAKTCASEKELLALAKENGINMTAEEAEKCFSEMHPKNSELNDDELGDVAGGWHLFQKHKKEGQVDDEVREDVNEENHGC